MHVSVTVFGFSEFLHVCLLEITVIIFPINSFFYSWMITNLQVIFVGCGMIRCSAKFWHSAHTHTLSHTGMSSAQAACLPVRRSSIKSDNKLLLLNDSKHGESSVSDCCSDSRSADSSNLTSSARPNRREDSFKLNQQTLHTSVSKWQGDVPWNCLNFKTQKSCEMTSASCSQPVLVYQSSW